MNYQKIAELYENDSKIRELIPSDILNWGMRVMDENWTKAKTETAKNIVEHKVGHTKEVIEAGWEIMEREKSVDWDIKTGTIVCFLHDIGRFPQAQTDTLIDQKSGIDHGALGSETFKEQNFGVKDKELISEAIYGHSRKAYEGKNEYCKFVRDADKLALFRNYEKMEAIDTRAHGLLGNEISEDRLSEFLGGEVCVDDTRFKSVADWYLHNGTWMWDLNFEATKQIWREENYPSMLISKFEKLNIDKDKFELIKKRLLMF